MRAYWIFSKDLLIMLRDRQTFIVLIFMPLLLIAILGAALSGVVKDNSKNASLTQFNIAVVDLDKTKESTLFVEDILMVRLSSFLNIEKMTESELERKFSKEKFTLVVCIPKGFGQSIINHQTPTVKLISKGEASIEKSILTFTLLHYQNVDLAIDQIVESMTRLFIMQAEQTGQRPEMSGISSQLATLHDSGGHLRQAKTEQNAKMGQQTVDSFQYYAVAMSVMFMLLTVNAIVGRMLTEKEEQVYKRQFMTHLTISEYLMGKFIGIVIITFLQLIIMIVGSRIIYNVYWGESIISIMFTMFTITMSTSAIGLLLAALINKVTTYTIVATIGTQILAALGGSFVPIYLFPEWMIPATKILPNALGLQMFLDIMTGATLKDIWPNGLIALSVSVILFAIAWFRMSRKGGGIHV